MSPQLAYRTAISSCTVCKKHFRSSQIFVQHLQSQEHRQKVEKVCVCYICKDISKYDIFAKLKMKLNTHLTSVLVVYQLQEKEGCEVLAKLTAMDTEGFLLEEEEEEGSEVEEREDGEQDCFEKQVIFM